MDLFDSGSAEIHAVGLGRQFLESIRPGPRYGEHSRSCLGMHSPLLVIVDDALDPSSINDAAMTDSMVVFMFKFMFGLCDLASHVDTAHLDIHTVAACGLWGLLVVVVSSYGLLCLVWFSLVSDLSHSICSSV